MRDALVLLALMIAANAGAWAAGRLAIGRLAAPLDGGRVLHDGRRLLGPHKTWCGLAGGTAACAAAASVLGAGAGTGALFGLLALLGDAGSSFVKRRLDAPAGADVPGLDQLPEVLLPAIVLAHPLGVGAAQIAAAAAAFFVADVATTRLRQPVPRRIRSRSRRRPAPPP